MVIEKIDSFAFESILKTQRGYLCFSCVGSDSVLMLDKSCWSLTSIEVYKKTFWMLSCLVWLAVKDQNAVSLWDPLAFGRFSSRSFPFVSFGIWFWFYCLHSFDEALLAAILSSFLFIAQATHPFTACGLRESLLADWED